MQRPFRFVVIVEENNDIVLHLYKLKGDTYAYSHTHNIQQKRRRIKGLEV